MVKNEHDMDLTVRIGPLVLKNPVMTASGTFGYGKEYESLVNIHQLGALVAKGISLQPRTGNPPLRVVETACGMLNAIGLQNVGLERFIAEKMPYLRQCKTKIIVNILGDSVDDYALLAERLNDVDGVAALEVNISCPNVKNGGVAFGTDPKMAHAVTKTVKNKTSLPVLIKLSPNVTDITAIARAVEDAGADAVSLINTVLGMAIDINTRKAKLGNIVGGLSGPAIKPIALRMVWQTAQAVKIPVIGIGGISTWEDAVEFIIAGASAIQVGTANFFNPRATMDILVGIQKYLKDNKIPSVNELTGSMGH